jgi:hypothetical protein
LTFALAALPFRGRGLNKGARRTSGKLRNLSDQTWTQEQPMTTRTHVTAALAAAAIVLAVILAASPQATIIASEAPGEIYGVDILGLTQHAQNLPEQHFPTH